MAATRLQVSGVVDAPAGRVFDLLASPYRHCELDPSGMVGAAVEDDPVTKVGQVFRMNMTWTGKDGTTSYQTDNHVTAFKANRAIAWAVAPADGEPFGWTWRWELEVKGKRDQKTKVTLTYDWSDADESTRRRYGVPLFDETALRRSVDLLAQVAEK